MQMNQKYATENIKLREAAKKKSVKVSEIRNLTDREVNKLALKGALRMRAVSESDAKFQENVKELETLLRNIKKKAK